MSSLHLFLLVMLLLISTKECASSCSSSARCGSIPVQYPFGVDDGCGNPDFRLSACDGPSPLLSSRNNSSRGSLVVNRIDYDNKFIQLSNSSTSSGACFLDSLPQGTNLAYCSSSSGDVLCVGSGSGCCIERVSSNSGNSCNSYKRASTSNSSNEGLSLNNLRIQWDVNASFEPNCTSCVSSKGQCGFNTTSDFICQCDSLNTTSRCPDDCASGNCRTNKKPIILSSTLAVVIIVVVLVFGVSLSIYWKWKKNGTAETQDPIFLMETDTLKNQADDIREMLSSRKGGEATRVFTLAEVEKACNGFSKENKIGSGGFGTVYKGVFEDGGVMAIKRANHTNKHSSQHFFNEVSVLSKVNHRNLVRLIGCCIDTDVPMLMFEFVPNGTLFDHLHRKTNKVLNWATRLRIAIETAEALSYLHSAALPPIYHRDVKSSNILLDINFTSKVADFGLSRLVPEDVTHVSTMVQGTPGYVDPEYYQTYQLTEKSDVYSFGVVLLELVTGRKPVDFSRASRDVNLSAYSVPLIRKGMLDELVDPRLEADTPELLNSIKSVANVAMACLAFFREERPTMKQVLEELVTIRGSSRLANEGLCFSEREQQHQQMQNQSWLQEDEVVVLSSFNPSAGMSYNSVTTSSSAREDHSTELTPR